MERFDKFEISDLGGSPLEEAKLYYNVTNKMKEDMNDAYIRLLGKNNSFVVQFGVNVRGETLVKSHKFNSLDGFNRHLCLRIDLQDLHMKEVAGREMQVANVQIQLNDQKRPSTIAQVHFQHGVEFPGDVVRRAFQRSWKEKKIIYVYERPGTSKK